MLLLLVDCFARCCEFLLACSSRSLCEGGDGGLGMTLSLRSLRGGVMMTVSGGVYTDAGGVNTGLSCVNGSIDVSGSGGM